MKKGVVVVLVLLAIAVLVAPAIVGRMVEKSMDENLDWVARESGELQVTSERFDRGWFSSAGRHRVELRDGQLVAASQTADGDDNPDELTALIIDTKIDHGLAQLATGSGKLVSTLQLELPGGETVDLPGTIYSTVGLTGALRSNYVVEAGSLDEKAVSANWSAADVLVEADPSTGEATFKGEVGPLSLGNDTERLSLAGVNFEGQQQQNAFGFATGNIAFSLDGLAIRSLGSPGGGVRAMSFDATTGLDDDKVVVDAAMRMAMHEIPQVGEMSLAMDFDIAGADAATIGRMQRSLRSARGSARDPKDVYAAIEDDLKQLFASGFELNFERLDVTLPQGTIEMEMSLDFGEEDLATFEWSSLLLSTEATVDVSIPAALVDAAGQGNPQLATAIGTGVLLKQGDVYIMEARLKKGLATVNGAPIPIPLGGF